MPRALRLIETYLEPVIIVACLGVVIVLLFADVVARFAFQTSIFWAGEVARFAFVYMIYFGISYAIREKRHLRVTLLVEQASPRVQRGLLALAELVFLGYSVVVCWLGVVITSNALARGQILPATQWPTAVLYAAIILSGALCVLRLSYSLWRILRHGDTVLSSAPGGAA